MIPFNHRRSSAPSPGRWARRLLTLALALLVTAPLALPLVIQIHVAALSATTAERTKTEAGTTNLPEVDPTPPNGTEHLHLPHFPSIAETLAEAASFLPAAPLTELSEAIEAETVATLLDQAENFILDQDKGETDKSPALSDKPTTDVPLEDTSEVLHTQESIARHVEAAMDKNARAGSRISYPWPSGAMAVALYKDGRRILSGQAADIGGTVYVPVQRFADLFGSFKTTYTAATESVVITGKNLSVTVRVGDPYITVNERIFYSGKAVLSLGGWIFVPLASMSKALNAGLTVRSGYYDAFITSGDPSRVAWADDYYNQTDLYWLARIISAEARGEPFAGQIAVGNVVLNRVRSSEFPNTVKGVIFDQKFGIQFSPVSSGTIYNTPTASAIRAAKICLEGYSLSTRMIYFYNPTIATSSWIGRTRPYIMTIGNHKFYA